ncbi:hypothetical protein BC829DRAFT_444159 [Chytridium lagenaria]|nr:hypothetical protein BC829DRAFT_444159 [Chytridium lagenaria]
MTVRLHHQQQLQQHNNIPDDFIHSLLPWLDRHSIAILRLVSRQWNRVTGSIPHVLFAPFHLLHRRSSESLKAAAEDKRFFGHAGMGPVMVLENDWVFIRELDLTGLSFMPPHATDKWFDSSFSGHLRPFENLNATHIKHTIRTNDGATPHKLPSGAVSVPPTQSCNMIDLFSRLPILTTLKLDPSTSPSSSPSSPPSPHSPIQRIDHHSFDHGSEMARRLAESAYGNGSLSVVQGIEDLSTSTCGSACEHCFLPGSVLSDVLGSALGPKMRSITFGDFGWSSVNEEEEAWKLATRYVNDAIVVTLARTCLNLQHLSLLVVTYDDITDASILSLSHHCPTSAPSSSTPAPSLQLPGSVTERTLMVCLSRCLLLRNLSIGGGAVTLSEAALRWTARQGGGGFGDGLGKEELGGEVELVRLEWDAFELVPLPLAPKHPTPSPTIPQRTPLNTTTIPTFWSALKQRHLLHLGTARAKKALHDPAYEFPHDFHRDAIAVFKAFCAVLSDPVRSRDMDALMNVMMKRVAGRFADGANALKEVQRGVRIEIEEGSPTPSYVAQSWLGLFTLMIPGHDAGFTSQQHQRRVLKAAEDDGCYIKVRCRVDAKVVMTVVDEKTGIPVLRDRRESVEMEFVSPHFSPWDEIFEEVEGGWRLKWCWRIADVDFLVGLWRRGLLL